MQTTTYFHPQFRNHRKPIMKMFLLGLLAVFFSACSSTRSASSSPSGGTTYFDSRTGLIIGENGRPVSPAQLRAEQQHALEVEHGNAGGGGFGRWAKEFYSVENMQKRMAIGAQLGGAFGQAYGRSMRESREAAARASFYNRSYDINRTGRDSWRVSPSYPIPAY